MMPALGADELERVDGPCREAGEQGARDQRDRVRRGPVAREHHRAEVDQDVEADERARRPIIAIRDRPDGGVVRVRRQSEQHEPGGEEVVEEAPRRADESDHERTPSERREWRRFDQVTRRCRNLVGGELGDPIATPFEALRRATVAAAPLDEGVGDLARSGCGLHGGARSTRRPRLRAPVACGRLLELDSFVDVIVGHWYAKRTGHGDVPSGHRR